MTKADTTGEIQTDKPYRFDFDAVAEKYDRWYDTPAGAMYDRLEKRAIARYLKQNGRGKRLLEIGCGSGHWSSFFAEHGFEVTGIDISSSMLQIAKSKNIPNAVFQPADAHSLPFDDNSFDITVAITTLEFLANAELAVQEMYRCTRKPGGQIIVAALNKISRLNRRRQGNPDSLYARAHLFTAGELKTMLHKYGRPSITTAGFLLNHKRLLPLSPLYDALARLFHLPYGDFITGRLKL